MLYYKEFKTLEKQTIGKRLKYDNNIFTFDIETTSYLRYGNEQYNSLLYDKLTEKEKLSYIPSTCMYIWMMGINDIVYYGRTWEEFKDFIKLIDEVIPETKIIFIHNLAFEFHYLYSNFRMDKVFARKSHKVIKAEFKDYNFELRCSMMMSNSKLADLPKTYNLPIEKMVGDLDYTLIRHPNTPLTEKELGYCEHDPLVIYYYIKEELKKYKYVNKIPITSTGHVRRELKELTEKDYKYRNQVRRSINTNPHIYNLLSQGAFQGGYTHSNYIYTDEILTDIDSWDETSAYPYVMVTHKFPAKEFKKCYIKDVSQMYDHFAYLLVVKMTNVKSKLYNHYISMSKCLSIKGGKYDNGRIIEAEEFTTIVTDVDFKLYFKCYDFDYEIIESYYSKYDYLPIKYINFILDKYVEKTKLKNVEGSEVQYNISKQMFNALYGMTVTNNIKDDVVFDGKTFTEVELSNEKIIEMLESEKKKAFLSFSYGVWVTAWARKNLIERAIDLDDYVVYMDTDSLKIIDGYDKNIILNYNESVKQRIKKVSKELNINIERFAPKDIKGNEHMLGLFELEKKDFQKHSYTEFITQGAKKYAYKEEVINKDTNEIEEKIKITVAGVPKKGKSALHDLRDFKDGFVFRYEDTNKNLLFYVENQEPFMLKDYLGNEYLVSDKTGCSLMPNSYTLGKALEYAHLISDDSSKRAVYKEDKQ